MAPTSIGIIGSGIAGLQLGLALQQHDIPATIYSERTPEQELARRLPNMVARNACTRARERQLGVNHWDSAPHDMHRLAMSIRGARLVSFSGRMGAAAQAVDMRIYCARLLEDFSSRGGRVVIATFNPQQLDAVAARHDLLVVASGRASLSTIFPRVAEHSPFTSPQRLCIGGLYRGVARSEPCALEVIVTPGSGEILAVPMQSFEPGLTGIGILIAAGGRFETLRHLRCTDDRRAFVAATLALLREHAPTIYERIDPRAFDLPRDLDLGHAAITPTVRRGFVELSNGRNVVALGDAHIVIDPITGQGANNASHAAGVLCQAILGADAFDRPFCLRVEREICSYVVPVSDAANARLGPAAPHFRELLAAAARNQAIADVYADSFDHPNRFWAIASDPEPTAAFLREFEARPASSAIVA
jgi:2-polyprenyl-6-methoxyphenol hydroxylase-like FAD-dependent oxidoreductase